MSETLQAKKEKLLKIAKDWYEGTQNPEEELTDFAFDKLEAEILEEDPEWDYRLLLDSQGDTRDHYLPMPKVHKEKQITTPMETLRRFFKIKRKDVVSLPKFDGGGLVLYYKDGKLYDALTRSSTLSGKRQISKVLKMVPEVVDKNISAIECEVICDLDKGHGKVSRQAATGLLTSKHEQERCEKELTVVAIAVRFYDDTKADWVKSMKDLPVVKIGDNTTFLPAYLNEGKYEGNTYEYRNSKGEVVFSALIDGIVTYNTKTKESVAYKLYYNEIVESVVTNIVYEMSKTSFKYVPSYRFKPVVVDGSNINKATSGGYAKLVENNQGIGSRVMIIKAGLTIPQVFCLAPKEKGNSNFGLPFKCGCGTSVGINDLANNGFFCPNSKCSVVEDLLIEEESLSSSDLETLIETKLNVVLDKFLKLPSYDSKKIKPFKNKDLTDILSSGSAKVEEVEKFLELTKSQKEALNKTLPYFNEYIKKYISIR